MLLVAHAVHSYEEADWPYLNRDGSFTSSFCVDLTDPNPEPPECRIGYVSGWTTYYVGVKAWDVTEGYSLREMSWSRNRSVSIPTHEMEQKWMHGKRLVDANGTAVPEVTYSENFFFAGASTYAGGYVGSGLSSGEILYFGQLEWPSCAEAISAGLLDENGNLSLDSWFGPFVNKYLLGNPSEIAPPADYGAATCEQVCENTWQSLRDHPYPGMADIPDCAYVPKMPAFADYLGAYFWTTTLAYLLKPLGLLFMLLTSASPSAPPGPPSIPPSLSPFAPPFAPPPSTPPPTAPPFTPPFAPPFSPP